MDSETFGPFGGVAVAEVLAFGRARAAQTGSGLNAVTTLARPSDISSFLANAQTEIDMDVANTGLASEDLHFEYLINGGELRLFGRNGSFDGLQATAAVNIFTLGASGFSGFLWDWGVTLRGTATSAEVLVHGFAPIFPFSDPLGLGQPVISSVTITGNEASVSIAPFTGVAELGQINPTQSALINYTMYSELSGPGLNNTGGEATIGDPFNLTGDAGTVLSIRGVDLSVVVPEPSTGVLAATCALILFSTSLATGSSRKRLLNPR
jgi:hypothetical protein